MLEQLITYAVVTCAAAYATWRLIPGSLRLALAEQLATLAQRFGLPESDAAALRRRAASSKSCGGCSGCASKPASGAVQIVIRKKES